LSRRRREATGADRSRHAVYSCGSSGGVSVRSRQQPTANLTKNLTVTSTPDFDESSVPVTLVVDIE
jgi:hypothetical protein